MQKLSIPFEKTGMFSKIIVDYLSGEPQLAPFYNWSLNTDEFLPIMEEKAKEQIDRAMLVVSLRQQYSKHTVTATTADNIEALGNDSTFCIVTAHQLNIFTGPLYVIYKTISAIKLCADLKIQYPGKQFVPVFWLGSEDHDFEEINHFNVFGKTYTWDDKQGGACGKYDTASINTILIELESAIGNDPNGKELITLFKASYNGHNNLAQATRAILNALFGHYGLVVVDGDDANFKAACSDIILDELQHQTAEKLVNNVLEKFPYAAQANPRNINLFYLQNNSRERIVLNEATGEYAVVNTAVTFSQSALIDEVKAHPENFSPNVILRPLFQQKVLPSLAYIGGGGEIAYWLQLKSLFSHFNVQLPMLLLRDSYLLVDRGSDKKIQKLNLTVEDFFQDEQSLINQFVRQNSEGLTDISKERDIIEGLFTGIIARAQQIDTSLDKAVLAEKQAVLQTLGKLEGKLVKAEKQKMDVQLGQIKGVHAKLFPGGGLQERQESFISWYMQYGKELFEILLQQSIQPAKAFTILNFGG